MSAVAFWVWAFLKPANLLGLLVVVGVLVFATLSRRIGVLMIAVAATIFLVVTLTPVTRMMLAPLEDRFSRPARIEEPVRGIIVLGGTSSARIAATRGSLDVNASGDRLIEAAALAHRFPEAELWLLGRLDAPSISTILTSLGVERARLRIEATSRNTYENLRNALPVARPRCDETWLLVTSAWHMPRAVGVARGLNWPVVAMPTDYRTWKGHDLVISVDFADSLSRLNIASKEWIGLALYHVRGWTPEFWPSAKEIERCEVPPGASGADRGRTTTSSAG